MKDAGTGGGVSLLKQCQQFQNNVSHFHQEIILASEIKETIKWYSYKNYKFIVTKTSASVSVVISDNNSSPCISTLYLHPRIWFIWLEVLPPPTLLNKFSIDNIGLFITIKIYEVFRFQHSSLCHHNLYLFPFTRLLSIVDAILPTQSQFFWNLSDNLQPSFTLKFHDLYFGRQNWNNQWLFSYLLPTHPQVFGEYTNNKQQISTNPPPAFFFVILPTNIFVSYI